MPVEAMRQWLRRLPRLHAVLQRGFYGGLYLFERHLLGTRLHEMMWRWRIDSDAGGPPHRDPRRTFLVERVGRFVPFGSVLEVGCGRGQNLLALARAFPGVRLLGVDINPRAVAAAAASLARQGIPDARVLVGRADDLRRFADGSVDVVLTAATLMYIGPDKISRVMSELVRVARRGLLLNEWHLFEDSGAGSCTWHYAHWVHDYDELLRALVRGKNWRVQRVPPGLWVPGGGWEQYGALIEVCINNGKR